MRRFVLPVTLEGTGSSTDEHSRTECVLTGDDHHYLIRVLRLERGDRFPAIDQSGVRVVCAIQTVTAQNLRVFVEKEQDIVETNREDAFTEPRITLFQGLTRGKKLDQIVRQATECGVAEIVPVRTKHSVVSLDESDALKRMKRWHRIAREAMQQSGDTARPEISEPIDVEAIPQLWKNRGPGLFCHQDRLDSSGFPDTLGAVKCDVAICIGPEGGFAVDEVRLLLDGGFEPVFLGPRVLRSETAAIYAIAAVQVLMQRRFC